MDLRDQMFVDQGDAKDRDQNDTKFVREALQAAWRHPITNEDENDSTAH
jgi:hypothetical protein